MFCPKRALLTGRMEAARLLAEPLLCSQAGLDLVILLPRSRSTEIRLRRVLPLPADMVQMAQADGNLPYSSGQNGALPTESQAF